jgi:hypothetical protein
MSFSRWMLGDCGCCGCTVRVCVTACPGSTPIPAANVALKQSGVALVSCATGADGCCSLSVSSAGTYEVVVTKTGYATYDRNRTLACGDTITVGLLGSASVTLHVLSDCTSGAQDLEGATAILDGISELTGSTGRASFGLTDAGTYSWTVSKARYVSQSGTVTLSYCSPASPGPSDIFLLPDTGYHCGPNLNCDNSPRDPVVPDTLNLTDSVYGATTVAYDVTDGHFRGTKSIAFPAACPGFTAGTRTLKYDFNPGGNGGRGSITISLLALVGGGSSVVATINGCTPSGLLDWDTDSSNSGFYNPCGGVCDLSLRCNVYLNGVTITITE